jgi:hypothetical protein
MLNEVYYTKALDNSGCLCYAAVRNPLLEYYKLPSISIPTEILDCVMENQGVSVYLCR